MKKAKTIEISHAHLNSNRGITLLRTGSLSITTDTVSRPILFIVTAPPRPVLTFLCQQRFPQPRHFASTTLSNLRYLDGVVDLRARGLGGLRPGYLGLPRLGG